jgi:hypothetical protein
MADLPWCADYRRLSARRNGGLGLMPRTLPRPFRIAMQGTLTDLRFDRPAPLRRFPQLAAPSALGSQVDILNQILVLPDR